MQRFNGAVTDVHTEMENQRERDGFIYRYGQTSGLTKLEKQKIGWILSHIQQSTANMVSKQP